MNDTPRLIKGQIAFLFAFDMAYDTSREVIPTLMGQRVIPAEPGHDPRFPREQMFYKPQSVKLPVKTMSSDRGPLSVACDIRLFSVGAISIRFTVPFEVECLRDLVCYQGLLLDKKLMAEHANELAVLAMRELAPTYVQPVAMPRVDQAYTVYCVQAGSVLGDSCPQALDWLKNHGRQAAGLLTGEPDEERLSTQEIEDVLSKPLSYYRHDLFLCSRQSTLLVDEAGQFDPALHIIELANVQLAELIAYDRVLDEGLHRGYRDLPSRGGRYKGRILRSLRELKIDLARLSDELTNTTKFQGDWHLARGYRILAQRLHLADWHKSVEDKLQTLDQLYQILKQDQVNRWMMVLEAAIVGLFIFEVVRLLIT